MTIEIPYQRWLDDIKRPIIDVELKLPNNKLHRTIALVDSGADSCVFDIEIFEVLGVNINEYPTRRSIAAGGNRFRSVEIPVTIKFNNIEIEARANCCSFKDEDGNFVGMNLLGREDFFKHFKITFDEKKKLMIFE